MISPSQSPTIKSSQNNMMNTKIGITKRKKKLYRKELSLMITMIVMEYQNPYKWLAKSTKRVQKKRKTPIMFNLS